MAAGRSKEMEIAIKIAGKVESSFKNALGAAAKGLGSITKTVASATAAAAAAVGALGVAAVNTGKEFETAMSQVAATMLLDKTTAEGQKAFETLENAARECGASTAFSATEAAEALNYLALAGYDADKAATALPTVLKLAGAGAMELADASDMVTDSMSALGIAATKENLEQFSDQMAKAASKSNTSVAQLGEGILTVGGTAKGLAGGTTELNTALGILADNGIKAAEGGTHLRNMILSLQQARNSDAAAIFEEIGFSAYDAQGNMRGLGEIFGEFNETLSGASAKHVNSFLATIFKQTDLASARAMLAATADSVESLGTVLDAALAESGTSMEALGIDLQAMADHFDTALTQEQFAAQMLDQFGMSGEQAATLFNGLQSLIGGTGNRFEELYAAIEDSKGACEDMYAIQLDNLNGDIDILKSGLADLGISVYKDLNGPLRESAQMATDMVGELSKAYSDGGMSGMAGAVGDCLSEIVDEAAEYAPKVVSLGVDLIKSFVQGIAENAGPLADAAAQTMTVFVGGLFELVPQVLLAGIDIITQLAGSISGQLPELANRGTQAILSFVNGITQRLPVLAAMALMLVQTFANSLGANAPQLISAAILLIGNLATGILSMLPNLLQIGIQLILNLAQGILSNLPLLLQMGTQIIVSLVNSITQGLPMLIQGGFQLITSLIHGIAENLPSIAQAAVTIILSLIGGLITAIPQLWAAAKMLPGKIKEAILDNNWLEIGWNLICSIGQGIIDGALSIGSSVMNTIKGWFGGGDSKADTSEQGAAVASGYANGISDNAGAVTAAADNMVTSAFSGMDISKAADAGTQAGAAFAGGLDAGLAGSVIDMSTLAVDTTGLTEVLTEAGTDGANAVSVGMSENSQIVTQAAESLGSGVNTALDGGWNKARANAQTAMQRITATVTTAARSAASAVKAAFENMTITIPKPKLPVISVSQNHVPYGEGGNINIPDFSVSWNALGGIFDRPTIFQTPVGMQGVGEAGAEAVLPLDTLWTKMREILNDAIAASGRASAVEALLEKLKGAATGGGRKQPEFAGAGGFNVVYSPIYNLYGSAGKKEIAEADRMSQAEFNRRMKQYKKDERRRKL